MKRLPTLKSYLRIWLDQLQDPTIKILLWAGLFTFFVGIYTYYENDHSKSELYEALSIFFAVLFISTFTAGTQKLQNKQFLKLHDEFKNEEVAVIRGQNGLSASCRVTELVVGDLIIVESGMRVPVDCVLIRGHDITVDEALYCEDKETIVPKSLSLGTLEDNNHTENPDPFLLSQSLVLSGQGVAVVCCVGKSTLISSIEGEKELDSGDADFTPLQQKLDNIAQQLGNWGYAAGFVVFVATCAYYLVKVTFTSQKVFDTTTLTQVLENFTLAVAVIIVAVPEGLPLSISIAMAFSVDKLMKEKLLIKQLSASESMGSVTEICTGKTATLTENKMRVHAFYTGEQSFQNKTKDSLTKSGINQNLVRIINNCIIYNNAAKIEMSDDAMYVPTGNGTEVGMLNLLSDNEISIYEQFKDREAQCDVETEIPFSSYRKRSLVALKDMRDDSEKVKIVVKGAPEFVLTQCTQAFSRDGRVVNLTHQERDRILRDEIEGKFCKRNLRAIVYAYKEISLNDYLNQREMNNDFITDDDRSVLEQELTFVAAFALEDKLREGVSSVISKFYHGGVNVRMISGDNLYTAIECAKEAGILQQNEESMEKVCMEGKEFRAYVGGVKKVQDPNGSERYEVVQKQNFRAIAQRLKVLARSTPDDKFTLIVGLKELGASIAVTAEGLNDAPALKHANVGFCMGIGGCQVAKEASDIVLLDDNFASVFRACQWGRNIYDNVRKFIQYQMTVNISCLFIVILGGLTLGAAPFNVIQMLWMNMVMDTLAAIALATEPPNPEDLNQQRIKKHDRVVLNVMWRTILGQCLYQILVLTILLYAGPAMFGITYNMVNAPYYAITSSSSSNSDFYNVATNRLIHYSFMFQTFMFMNIFNTFNCRKLQPKEFNIFSSFFNNFLFLIIIAAEFVI